MFYLRWLTKEKLSLQKQANLGYSRGILQGQVSRLRFDNFDED